MAEGGEKRSPTAHRTPGQIRRHTRTYQRRPDQLKNRAARARARYALMKEGKVKKGDGKEVDHIRKLSKGGSNNKSNLRVVSRRLNRSKHNKKS